MQVIKEEHKHNFQVSKTGLFSISISARCKSGEQTGVKGGEDLRVEIDDKKFREVPPKDKVQYQDVPSAWNGTKLKGLKKTVIFILRLNRGEHIIRFVPYQGATIEEEPKIEFIENTSNIIFNLEEQAEDGDRRPWITFVLVDLPLKQVQTEMKTERRRFDSDDVKIIIDDEVKRNLRNIFRALWFWVGSLFKEGKTQIDSFDINFKSGLHYIEFWADRMPTLYTVKLELGDIRTKAKVVWQQTVLREGPSQTFGRIKDVKKDEEVIILEKAVKGEKPEVNEKGDLGNSNRWHKVEYQNNEGFIYSEALEIRGEDEESIKKLIIQKSEGLKEDKCLMSAVAWRESKFFPYAVSDVDAQGIFQLKEIAVAHVNEKFGKNFSDRFDINQNIEAGIFYFQIVKEKYQGKDELWEKCLAAWNRGMDRVEAEKSFVMSEQPIHTQEFIKDVFEFWENCKNDFTNKGKILLFSLLVIGIMCLTASTLLFLRRESFPIPSEYKNFDILTEEKVDIDKDGREEKLAVISNVSKYFTSGVTKILLIKKDGSFLELPDDGLELRWFKTGDINRNGKMDIAVLFGYSGSGGWGQFYLYEWDDGNFITLFSRDEMGGEAYFQDLDSDNREEMVFGFYPEKWGRKHLQFYKWDEEKLSYVLNNDSRSELDLWREVNCPKCVVLN